MAVWRKQWPEIAARHRDADGRPPQYGFFYPAEEYRPELLDPLAEMTRLGIGDVEVHLHHDADTSAGFAEKVRAFTEALHSRHGLLRRHDGKLAFGFIHGNWALDNGRPDGRWCGVNDEIRVLRDLGCYADFTMPAAPDPSQGGLVNTIYRVTDDPERPRSYETGIPVVAGTPAVGDLTMIPGPLGVIWKPNGRIKPRLDTGELASYALSSPARSRLWVAVAPRIGGHAFVKALLARCAGKERHCAPRRRSRQPLRARRRGVRGNRRSAALRDCVGDVACRRGPARGPNPMSPAPRGVRLEPLPELDRAATRVVQPRSAEGPP